MRQYDFIMSNETSYSSFHIGILRTRWLLVVLLMYLAGCASIGPPTVKRDRFDYIVAISESFKRQTLLNLVKTRYMDAPVFMDIDSVISQYTIEGELGFEFAPSFSNNSLLLGNSKYSDRPTITFSPLTGEKYSRSLLKPIPVSSIFMLLQSGYPIDAILRICVQSMNGIENRRSGALSSNEADPRFVEALALMRDLQGIGKLYYRLDFVEEKLEVKLGFRTATSTAAINKGIQLRQLLGLDTKTTEFKVVFGVQPDTNNEIAVVSRSMTQIMIEYAADIEVPQSDIDEGRVTRTASVTTDNNIGGLPIIRIHNGIVQPDDAHVAVFYRDKWYWVNDTDMYSKATLQFLMVLFSLTERGTSDNLIPVITVPTN